jgi:hypothetical protein
MFALLLLQKQVLSGSLQRETSIPNSTESGCTAAFAVANDDFSKSPGMLVRTQNKASTNGALMTSLRAYHDHDASKDASLIYRVVHIPQIWMSVISSAKGRIFIVGGTSMNAIVSLVAQAFCACIDRL